MSWLSRLDAQTDLSYSCTSGDTELVCVLCQVHSCQCTKPVVSNFEFLSKVVVEEINTRTTCCVPVCLSSDTLERWSTLMHKNRNSCSHSTVPRSNWKPHVPKVWMLAGPKIPQMPIPSRRFVQNISFFSNHKTQNIAKMPNHTNIWDNKRATFKRKKLENTQPQKRTRWKDDDSRICRSPSGKKGTGFVFVGHSPQDQLDVDRKYETSIWTNCSDWNHAIVSFSAYWDGCIPCLILRSSH